MDQGRGREGVPHSWRQPMRPAVTAAGPGSRDHGRILRRWDGGSLTVVREDRRVKGAFPPPGGVPRTSYAY